jgi:hypothetical protein
LFIDIRVQSGVLGDLLSKRIYDALAGIQNDQGWSRTPRRRQIDIKGEEAKKPGCEELGIQEFSFSMKMFSCPKSYTVAQSVARIREEVAQLSDADSMH